MKEKTQYAALILKIGALFAQCDGFVDEREKQFTKQFISDLTEERMIDETDCAKLNEAILTPVTFDSVTKEMGLFLSQFNDEERKKIIEVTSEFINKLIIVDEVISEEESSLLKRWNEAIH